MFEATVIHMRNPVLLFERNIELMGAPKRIIDIIREKGLIRGHGKYMERLANFLVSSNMEPYIPGDDTTGPYLADWPEWERELLPNEILLIQAVPLGKGGSRIVGLLAIAVLSYYTGGLAAGATGAAAGSATYGAAFAAASIATTIVGGMLLNAVLPLPKPKVNGDQTSPNYTINPSGNTARLTQAIPVIYGRFRVYPDYAATPYTENRGDDMYLYQLFAIGQGKHTIEQIIVGNTNLERFPDVQTQIVNPGERVTLFPDNVITSDDVQGIQLLNTKEAGISGTENWTVAYALGAPGTKVTRIGIDLSYPQGVFYVNDKGNKKANQMAWEIQTQVIDDSGQSIGPWVTQQVYNASTLAEDPKNLTFTYDVAEGRYQVRMTKLDVGDIDTTHISTLTWTGLKGYVASVASYGNLTMLAVVMKATNAVNTSTQHQVSVIARRILPVWDGNTWTEQETRNPAWALADMFRDSEYGAAWADSRLSLDRLLSLAQTWEARQDYFDGVFDTKTTVWEAAKSVCRVGRAVPLYYAGVVDFIRDEPKSARTLMLHPGNTVAGSFSVSYQQITDETPDYVVAQYTDPDTWKPATVDCAMSDSQKLVPKTIEFPGIVNHDHAFREGIYAAASNRDQRKIISLSTELVGQVAQYGDLVGVANDVTGWGQPGTVLALNRANGVLTLSDPVQFSTDAPAHNIALQARNGSVQGPYRVVQGADQFHVVLSGLTADQINAIYFSDGSSDIVPTAYSFGPSALQFQDCVLLTGQPSSNGQTQLTLVNYSATVHVAETDQTVPPPSSPSGLTDPSLAPSVGGVGVTIPPGAGEGGYIWVSVLPVAGATLYEFEISYDNGTTWSPLGISPQAKIYVRLPAGNWLIRARAYGRGSLPGDWTTTPVTIDGKPWPLGAIQNFAASSAVFGINLLWSFPDDWGVLDAGATEIRYSTTASFNASQLLARLSYPTNAYSMVGLPPGYSLFFWARLISKTTGDPGPWTAMINGQTSSDASAILQYIAGKLSEDQLTQELIAKIDAGSDAAADFAAVEDRLDQMQGEFDQVSGIVTRFSPQLIGDNVGLVGNTAGLIGVYSEISARQEMDFYVGRRVDGLIVQVGDAQAAIVTEQTVRANADSANATAITNLSATVGNLSSTVQTNAQAVVDLNGRVAASYQIKVQINTATGKYYAAGMSIGVDNASGIAQSQIVFQADLFSLINVSNGNVSTPFTILNGVTYISSAFIQDGTITNAKIANVIQSTAVDASGNPLWKLDKAGGFTQRSAASGQRTELTSSALSVYDANGTLRVKAGIL